MKKNAFLFSELVKRDFKEKYKRTALGMGWSLLSPLLNLLVMTLVFSRFFANNVEHYTIYLFCGNLVFAYYREATNGGMGSLVTNAAIFTKVNVPKYLFLLSRNVSALINFLLTLCIFFLFCALDGIRFGWQFLGLLYPILCLVLFNIGIGLILSALYIFFKDILPRNEAELHALSDAFLKRRQQAQQQRQASEVQQLENLLGASSPEAAVEAARNTLKKLCPEALSGAG